MKYLMILSFILFTIISAQAQIKKRPVSRIDEKEEAETLVFQDKFKADIKIGNVGFFGNLSLSGKFQAGYPLTSYLSAGLGAKIFYTQIFIASGPDAKYTDLGSFLYARAKIFSQFYVQAEYNFTAYDYVNSTYPGANIYYPSVGAGYVSGYGNWRYGLELNFLINDLARAYQGSVLEYWAGAFYHF